MNITPRIPNHYDNPLFSTYFESREHYAYYYSIPQAKTRRDFHERLLQSTESFLSQITTKSSIYAIQEFIYDRMTPSNLESFHSKPEDELTKSILDYMRRMNPIGLHLLDLSTPITFQHLKQQYRAASKIYHPDMGGNHEQMLAINDANTQIHKLLIDNMILDEPKYIDPHTDNLLHEAASIYVREIILLTALVYCDEWALDRSLMKYLKLLDDAFGVYLRSFRFADWRNLLLNIFQLVRRLKYANMHKELCMLEAGFSKSLSAITATEELSGAEIDNIRDEYNNSISRIDPLSRLQLNHKRQAVNAFRLGLINESTLKATMVKLIEKDGDKKILQSKLDNFLANFQFQELPVDGEIHFRTKTSETEFIPFCNSFNGKFSSLSEAQISEYNLAFSCLTNVDLVKKYTYIRLDRLIRTYIYHYSVFSAESLLREIDILQELSKENVYCKIAHSIISFIDSLSENERHTRLATLRELDGTISSRSDCYSPYSIAPTPAYEESSKLAIHELQEILASGDYNPIAYGKYNSREWKEVTERLDNFHKTAVSINSYKVTSAYPPAQPIEIIQALEPYCNTLLMFIDQFGCHELYNISFWIDTLTIAYGKLDHWAKAKEWLDVFFNFPEEIIIASPKAEQTKMKKRLERSNKKLGKGI